MNKELISYLKLFHGVYNTCMITLFVYQATLGVKIRKSSASDIHTIRRHRKIGPVAVLLGTSGFVAGMTVVYLDAGHVLKYPLHFFTGLTIAALLVTTYSISKKIKGPEKHWRNRHYVLGIFILIFYFVQAILGLAILL